MNNKIVCIYPIDKTTEFLLPIFERLQKESLSSTYKCNFLGADNKQ